jgi:hypothetical protein
MGGPLASERVAHFVGMRTMDAFRDLEASRGLRETVQAVAYWIDDRI